MLLGMLFSVPIGPRFHRVKMASTPVFAICYELGIIALLVGSVAALASQTHHAFIYFRF
jgi:hypothetical protein